MSRVPIADRLIWAAVMRPQMSLVYLDINHFIGLARAMVGASTAHRGYADLLGAGRRAVQEKRALFPLPGEHLLDITALKSSRQRYDIAEIMEELSGFDYLLGRIEIAQLEVEAGRGT